MKKWFILLLALLCAAVSAGCAEENTPASPGLFELYAADGEEPVWLGTAVSPYEGILVTAASVLPENLERLIVTDGVNIWDAEAAAPDRSGLGVMILFDTEDAKPLIGQFELESGTALTGDYYVVTGDERLSRINRSIFSASPLNWRGSSCTVLTLSGSAAPGSPLISPEGKLAGIAVGEWAEGRNRVIFLTVEGLLQSITEALDTFAGQAPINVPDGLAVTMDANTVTFDWSGMTLPEKQDGEELYLVVADSMNHYLTYCRAEDGDGRYTMILTPGRTYLYGVGPSAGAPDKIPEAFGTVEIPPAEKLADYGFESKVIAIAEGTEGMAETDLPVPVTEVTEELLRSGRAYFYSSSTYQVTEQIQGISLLVTLTDPDGNNYRYESGWIYDPSYMADDTWAVALKDTDLLEFLNDSGYPAGTYEIAMYIGGKLADSFTFELK